MKKIFLGLFLFFSFLNAAYSITLDEKIGQMIIIGFKGKTVKDSSFKTLLKQIKKSDISGVILFNRNIKSKQDLIEMNNKILSKNPIIPFIAIDNEGGNIQRYPKTEEFYFSKSAKDVSYLDENEAKEEYSKMADFEKELKINLNFAPDVDLELNEKSIISIKNRSYGKDSQIVSMYSKIFIEEHNKKGIITSIKHFPGHGSIDVDTHLDFADSTNTFKKEELDPYINLKDENKMNMVMVSHIFNSNFDDKYPASLSKNTIDYLKNEIGFEGVIVSDDYDMGAIKNNYSLDETLKLAINSGINLLIFSNNIKTYDKNIVKKIHKSIKKQVKSGQINIDNINSSYEKILKLKSKI